MPTLAEARAHYLQIVGPLNEAAAAIGTAGTDPAKHVAALQKWVAAEDRFARDLSGYRWPPAAAPIAARLVTATLQNRAAVGSRLQSGTDSAEAGVLRTDAVAAGVATELRIALGLPSN